MARFHHFSIYNQNQSISILVSFGQNTKAYSLTFWPNMARFHHFSIYNQNQSISILVSFGQNTKAIALLFGQNWLVFITFNLQSKSINLSFGQFWAKYQGYSLTVWPKMARFHHFSIYNQNNQSQFWSVLGKIPRPIALLFGQIWLVFITFQSTSKSINLNFGQFWAKYQGYSLTFWPKMARFHHFSIYNQNQSISGLVSFGQIPRL